MVLVLLRNCNPTHIVYSDSRRAQPLPAIVGTRIVRQPLRRLGVSFFHKNPLWPRVTTDADNRRIYVRARHLVFSRLAAITQLALSEKPTNCIPTGNVERDLPTEKSP